jgi:outer membrane usher protein FimD/PapC
MSRETQIIVPAYRSGTLVDFGIRRVRAVEGVLQIRSGETLVSADNLNFRLAGEAGAQQFKTGRDGRFYIEDLAAGVYRGEIPSANCRFSLTVPVSNESVVALPGVNICD